MFREGSQSVTIAEVAQRASVSVTTVSIVVRGLDKERRISAETAGRVRAAVEELNYVPNRFARNLRLRRTGMIGVVMTNLRADWAETVMGGMLEVFRPREHTPFVAIHHFDAQLAHKELLACLQRRDEGVICQPMPGERKLYEQLWLAGLPVIFLGDRPEDVPEVSFVGWDSGAAARIAVEHLVETGRRRIAFIGVDYPMRMTRGRYQAYVDVLREAGLPARAEWTAKAPMDWSLPRIVDWSLDRLFASGPERPDAIFALNDGIALPLLEAMDARGITVPEDVAVIGMGDLPMTGHRGIGLSTVREPCAEMGREAAQLMLDLIANPDIGPVQRLIPGRELKVRRTTQPRNVASRS